jgi:hypothetical protein
MSCASIIGVQTVDFEYAQSCEIENTQEVSDPLLNRVGQFVCANTHSARNNFTVTGKGVEPDTLPAGAVIDNDIFGFAAGVTVVKTLRKSQRAGQPIEWTSTGTNYPHADNGEVAP